MNLHALNKALENALKDAEEKREAALPCANLDAARTILADAARAWDEPNPFSVGDIIKPAPHSGMWGPRFGFVRVRRIYARVRMEPDDIHRIVSHDMTVLAVSDSGTVGEFLADSRDFELVEKAS